MIFWLVNCQQWITVIKIFLFRRFLQFGVNHSEISDGQAVALWKSKIRYYVLNPLYECWIQNHLVIGRIFELIFQKQVIVDSLKLLSWNRKLQFYIGQRMGAGMYLPKCTRVNSLPSCHWLKKCIKAMKIRYQAIAQILYRWFKLSRVSAISLKLLSAS